MKKPSDRLLAHIGRLTLEGRLPADRAALASLLAEQGFTAADIEAALPAAAPGAASAVEGESQPVPMHQLSESATRFLNALRELGYLDDLAEDEILDALLQEHEGTVSLEDLRPHVAAVLFDRRGSMDAEMQRYLEEEWRLAFH